MARAVGRLLGTSARSGRRTATNTLIAVAGALVLAACSSSSSGGSTTSPTATTTTSPTATKAPIVVGGVASASDFAGTDQGFKARIARQNAAGGIDGHQIKFVGVLDDNATAATDLTDVKQLVLSDHVVAVAPVNSLAFLSASGAFAAKNQTPTIGWGFLPTFCNNKWAWGFNGCLEPTGIYNTSTVEPMLKTLGNPKDVRVATVANNNPPGISGTTLFKNLYGLEGASFVLGDDSMPVTGVTDYTPYVSKIMASKANLVALDTTFSQNTALRSALVAAGYTGATMDYQSYIPGFLAAQPAVAKALKGNYVNTQIPPQEDATAAVKQETKDLVAFGQPPLVTFGQSLGYWQADMLIQMLQATATAGRPLTGAGLEQTVNAGFTYRGALAGGIGEAAFPQAEQVPVPCAALLQVAGKVYKVVRPFACYSNIKAK